MNYLLTTLKKYSGLLFGSMALLFYFLIKPFPFLVNQFYYRGCFQLLRVLYDYTLGLLPIPMVYFLFFALVFFIVRHLKAIQKNWNNSHILKSGLQSLGFLLSMFGWIGFAFYFLWGYNYQRTPIGEDLGLNFDAQIEDSLIIKEARWISTLMINKRSEINLPDRVLSKKDLPPQLEQVVRKNLSAILGELGYPNYGRPRVRVLRPKGVLLRISTAGVYIPFVGEGHLDAGLHPIQYPFTMAHEMTHAYGFTDEGVCNFIAFLACQKSDNLVLHYSSLRVYWLYLMTQIRSAYPEEYRKLQSSLTPEIKNDFAEVNTYMDRYPDLMPAVRNKIYDSYLKTNGVSSGISSYSQIVKMMMAWKRSNLNPTIQSQLYASEVVQ